MSDIARALDKTPANFLQQLSRGDFRESDLRKIAAALGVDLVLDFKE